MWYRRWRECVKEREREKKERRRHDRKAKTNKHGRPQTRLTELIDGEELEGDV